MKEKVLDFLIYLLEHMVAPILAYKAGQDKERLNQLEAENKFDEKAKATRDRLDADPDYVKRVRDRFKG